MDTTTDDPFRYLGLVLQAPCPHCKKRVPINGAIIEMSCPHCRLPFKNSAREMARIIKDVDNLWDSLGNGEKQEWYYAEKDTHITQIRENPRCGSCKSPLPLDIIPLEGHGRFACTKCGRERWYYEAPKWLKSKVPSSFQIIGGEVEPWMDDVTLSLGLKGEDAVTMECPSCGASFPLGELKGSHTSCSYCGKEAIVPDGILKKIAPPIVEPVKWYMRFKGPSASMISLQKEIAHREERNMLEVERERERLEREKQQKAEAERVRNEKEAEKQRIREARQHEQRVERERLEALERQRIREETEQRQLEDERRREEQARSRRRTTVAIIVVLAAVVLFLITMIFLFP